MQSKDVSQQIKSEPVQIKSRKFSRRAFLQGLSAISVGVTVSACVPAAQESGPEEGASGPAEKTTVVWSFWGTSDPDFIEAQRKLAAPFTEANPDIVVEPLPNSGNYTEKVMSMLAGGTPLDAVKVSSSDMARFVAEGALRPLDDYLAADSDFSSLDGGLFNGASSFYPFTIAQNCQIHNDKLYGLPNGESARVVYFNVDMFNEAGLPDPRELQEKGEWTHEAYFEAALTLTQGEGAEKVFGTAVNFSDPRATLTWIHQNGGNYFDEDFTESIIDQPVAVQTVQQMLELITVHKAAPSAQDREILGGNSQALASGRLAMFPDCGIWCTNTLKKITDFEWDAVEMPRGAVDQRTAYPPHGYTIPVATEIPEAAYLFNKYITGPEVEKSFIVDGVFECKHPVNEQFFIENAPVKNSKLFINWLKDGNVFYPPFNPMWPEMRQAIVDSLEEMLAGGVTVQEGLTDAKVKLDAMVQDIREEFPGMIPVVA